MIGLHEPTTRKSDNDMFTSTLTFSCKKFSSHQAFSKSDFSPASTCEEPTISPCYEERESSQTQVEENNQTNQNSNRGFRKSFNYQENIREQNENCQIIERVLTNQNYNLKQQNRLLLNQINKLRKQNKKHKQIYNMQKHELMKVQEECQVQRERAAYMKGIIIDKLMAIEDKINTTDTENTSRSESLLEQSLTSQNGRYSYPNH